LKKNKSKEQLGKGIRALLSGLDEDVSAKKMPAKQVKQVINTIIELPLTQIEVNPFQPRTHFDEMALNELANSIQIHGVVQPITVRRMGPNKYQLIAGERRIRASKIAGINTIPAYIRLADDQQMLEIGLIENIQREDLNPVEIALTYQRLIDECDLIHEQLAERVGKNRSTVTNYLRLLKLPPEVQTGLKEKTLSMGHARAIAGIEDMVLQIAVSKEVMDNKLSVRQTEALVKKYTTPAAAKKPKADPSHSLPLAYKKLQDELTSQLATKVAIKRKPRGQGEIIINFYSDDDLNRLIDFFGEIG